MKHSKPNQDATTVSLDNPTTALQLSNPVQPREYRRRVAFNFPKKLDEKGNPVGVKAHRPNCKRALVVDMLTSESGATFSEVAQAIEATFGASEAWDGSTCYEGIKLIHSELGYALTEDKDGIIRATA